MQYILSVTDDFSKRKKFSTTLRLDTLKKLETAKAYLQMEQPKITKYEIIELALDSYFKQMNMKECEVEEIVPVVVKKKGFEVSDEKLC